MPNSGCCIRIEASSIGPEHGRFDVRLDLLSEQNQGIRLTNQMIQYLDQATCCDSLLEH